MSSAKKMVSLIAAAAILLILVAAVVVFGVNYAPTENPRTGESFREVVCEGSLTYSHFSDDVSKVSFNSVSCAYTGNDLCRRGADSFSIFGFEDVELWMEDDLGRLPGPDATEKFEFFRAQIKDTERFQVSGCSSADSLTVRFEDQAGVKTSQEVNLQ